MNENTLISRIEEIIKEQTGIVIERSRKIDLEIVLRSRLSFHKMTPEKYVEFLKKNHDEIVVVASYFTIQETSFYRNKSHFDRLKLAILPEIIAKNQKEGKKKLNILSAGCATGEEPYTISMILLDLIPDIDNWSISITATDINEKAIAAAKEAVFTEYKLRNTEKWYIDRYFIKTLEGRTKLFKLKDEVKRFVNFRHCNLIREPFELSDLSDVDIVFCENVIIYFCMDSIQRLINNFYNILRMDGYLFLGYSETLNFIQHKFSLSWWHDSYIYKKSDKAEDEVFYNIAQANDPIANFQIEEEDSEAFIQEKSYEDIIELILKNYNEELYENISGMFKRVEESKIKLNEVYYLIKAEYKYDSKDYVNAANECRKAININPHSVDAHIILGAIYYEMKMYDSSVFECRTALYIDKLSILANYFLALSQKSLNSESEYVNHLYNAKSLFVGNGSRLQTRVFPVNDSTRSRINKDLMDII
jgi:chemotaxis protein methyltransferase CheR